MYFGIPLTSLNLNTHTHICIKINLGNRNTHTHHELKSYVDIFHNTHENPLYNLCFYRIILLWWKAVIPSLFLSTARIFFFRRLMSVFWASWLICFVKKKTKKQHAEVLYVRHVFSVTLAVSPITGEVIHYRLHSEAQASFAWLPCECSAWHDL